jgi:tetratricopeptide (TPR) repeat protein
MTEQHYDEEVLIDVILGEGEKSLLLEVQAHSESCLPCRRQLDSLRDFLTQLENPENWDVEPTLAASTSDLTDSLRPLADSANRLAAEEREASEWLAEPRGIAPRTAGMVRMFLQKAREEFDRQPARALELADTAITIADDLGNAHSAPLRAELGAAARREAANALRLLGRFEEALDRLSEALTILEPFAGAGFQRACVEYVRGSVLWQLGRPEEALRCAEESAEAFLLFGDMKRRAHASILAGGIWFEKGDVSKARELFLEQVRTLQTVGDTRNLANVFNNIAHCDVLTGDRDSAATFFLQALRLYEELGYETSKAHVQWGLGRLLLADGKVREALERMRLAESSFSKVAMRTQEGLVGLEIVEVRLGTGDPTGVAQRCRELIDLFRAASLPSNADAALAYLQEAVQSQKLDAPTVQYVRAFLEKAPSEPQLIFAAPSPRE